jgi:hypothetical protein
MMVDLLSLLTDYRGPTDIETAAAFFIGRSPQFAPEACLFTVYKAPPAAVLEELSLELSFGPQLKEAYSSFNGAHLFVNALSIFGCSFPQPFDRSNRFNLPPFDIRDPNMELRSALRPKGLIAVGAYSVDGSIVCVERETGSVNCFFGEDVSRTRARWPSMDDWLRREVTRLSALHDACGSLSRAAGEMILPGPEIVNE